ncbi:hypothetical protein J2TS4_19430 [Paenibacillus sp. J2TS4]|nr:hypothetical protein J2TS4_19430 [Paenibacillus sp. J2TS4]
MQMCSQWTTFVLISTNLLQMCSRFVHFGPKTGGSKDLTVEMQAMV